eukprot:CAMPEP_0206321584 /NCGR_PEP_ID=MMETSP0106_2-20121207/18960_1 /ASSEMBLY_ACC=CAM_ASM_000206 /TAXON_ID=81532 /ORGANISM="Acanthoeca-like sp., Strain 10tr" /LENGTH=146 /DNA_ID=CAMNT_0053753679 /DNA_START=2144 /DNA_END=2584 /DNA_ORIENTATION=-
MGWLAWQQVSRNAAMALGALTSKIVSLAGDLVHGLLLGCLKNPSVNVGAVRRCRVPKNVVEEIHESIAPNDRVRAYLMQWFGDGLKETRVVEKAPTRNPVVKDVCGKLERLVWYDEVELRAVDPCTWSIVEWRRRPVYDWPVFDFE